MENTRLSTAIRETFRFTATVHTAVPHFRQGRKEGRAGQKKKKHFHLEAASTRARSLGAQKGTRMHCSKISPGRARADTCTDRLLRVMPDNKRIMETWKPAVSNARIAPLSLLVPAHELPGSMQYGWHPPACPVPLRNCFLYWCRLGEGFLYVRFQCIIRFAKVLCPPT